MNPTIDRLKLVFVGIFALACAATWAYQVFYVWPEKRCTAEGRWWDSSTRVCATPIYIPSITGRPEGVSRREWSEAQAYKAVAEDQF